MSGARVVHEFDNWNVVRCHNSDRERGGSVFQVCGRFRGVRPASRVVVTLVVLPSGVRHYFTDNGRGLPVVLSAYLWDMVDAEELANA